ncbi:uncharacterized protein LOC107626855 [Arachis ipaensis]|uniref:uncharacterized protein LOC107626855 n=1 Tax=Arachis ipaensis TaxID=130454 RepID=UPI0007AF1AC0|nr:uncharacterized protein LOC107626855 [Arachis ipaensis]XP_025635653.1 uncharacterized protein LOC112729707 [Arachis hypogaea]
MRDFGNWIQDMNLVDLPLQDRKFTWRRGSQANRLDRICVDPQWLQKFPESRIDVLKYSMSNHVPLCLMADRLQWGLKPFCSLDIWFSSPKFLPMLGEEWRALGELPMHEKLKLIKKNISKWNKKVFGNIDDKIRRLESEIAKVEVLLEGNIKAEINLSRKKVLVGLLDIWYKQKGEYWKQMSREKYIKEVDKNTRYFHTMATIRSRKKQIREIKIGNRHFKDPRRIKNEVRKFFKNLYHQDRMPVIRVQEGLVARLSEEQAMQLELIPSYIKVKEAVWSCSSTKAPGPDGFNMFFAKNSWEIIGMEFTESILDFFRMEFLHRNLNMT